jgi:prepilin-type N-terminal cleavage/methylation domain-containing protein
MTASSRSTEAAVPRRGQSGFTLTELAIVVFIIGILLGGVVLTLEAQTAARNVTETQRRIEMAREAIIGFAIQNGRLPCPATDTSGGVEALDPGAGGLSDAQYGKCTVWDGLLPAATLGLAPTDAQGFLVDAWSLTDLTSNRIRYAVTDVLSPMASPAQYAYTGKDALQKSWYSVPPDLVICPSAPTAAPATSCNTGVPTFRAAAVVYSLGKNASVAVGLGRAGFEGSGASADEKENFNNASPKAFVAHGPVPEGANEFDDIVMWIPAGVLVNRMVSAGRF